MTSSRRDFLKIGGATAAYGALASSAHAQAAEPTLGLIFPPLD